MNIRRRRLRRLTPREEHIYNNGERLIPGRTHDSDELIRHCSSYLFFRLVIANDLTITEGTDPPVKIIDLGCGVGHGCRTLSELPSSQITGVDISHESLEYARNHYSSENIRYEQADLVDFIPRMSEYDYAVSRNTLEHLPTGLQLAKRIKWRRRLIFDVPYNESKGRNIHHALSEITEKDLVGFEEMEIFYQDLAGWIYDAQHKPDRPNLIICVCSHPSLPQVADCLSEFDTVGRFQPLCNITKRDWLYPFFPLVSIVTPAYNRASYLDDTIQSVLEQSYPHIQYIVLDDGSTDNTKDVLEKYTGRLIWETHPNMGETRSVNKGFSLAKGEIVGVVNSDDPLLPGAISTIVGEMITNPELLVVYPDWMMIDEAGKTIQRITTYDYSYINMVRWHHCIPGPGTFFRRSVIDRLQGRDLQFRYVADFDFWLRAGLLGPFGRAPSTLATFRTHSDSASISAKGKAMGEEHIRLIEKLYQFPNLPPDVLRIQKEAYSSAYYIAGCVCGNAKTGKRRYFLHALRYAPWKYLGEYRSRLRVMLPEMPFVRVVMNLYESLRRPRRAVRFIINKLGKWQKKRCYSILRSCTLANGSNPKRIRSNLLRL